MRISWAPALTAAAEIALCPDGRFEVRFGTVNIGQGSDTTMAQMAAEALGVPIIAKDDIHALL
ncbi:MAG: molybdopterin cofactor-binding domain-containing protein, partial [candidate division NC10 bacterium]